MNRKSANIRAGIFSVLELIADAEQQTALERSAPHVDVPAEIFCKWGDDLYHPETVEFAEAFTPREREVLATFNQAFNAIHGSLPQALPPLDVFMRSDALRRYRDAARRALDVLGGGVGP